MFRSSLVLCALLTTVPFGEGGGLPMRADSQRARPTELIADLAASDAAVRTRAACGLRELGDRAVDAIGPLVRCSPTARRSTARSAAGDGRSNGEENLTSPGEEAAAALVAIGTRAFQPVLEALEQEAWIARRNAAWALGALDDNRAVASAHRRAARSRGAGPPAGGVGARRHRRRAGVPRSSRRSRIRTARATPGRMGARRLDDHARSRRSSKRCAIASAGPPAVGVGARRDRRYAGRAGAHGRAQGRRRSRAPPGRLGPWRTRRLARRAGLVQALEDADEKTRTQAAWALGAIDDRAAVPAARARARRQIRGRPQTGAWALGAIDDPGGVERADAGADDESPEGQRAGGLGPRGDRRLARAPGSARRAQGRQRRRPPSGRMGDWRHREISARQVARSRGPASM